MAYRSYGGFRLNTVWILIGINFLFFIATLIAPELVFRLGLRPASFPQQPWTIITNLFIHGGFFHIFANMLTLFFFGTYLLRLIGEGRFLIVYFGGGILGNLLFIFLGYTLGIDFFVTAVGVPEYNERR